MQELLTVIAQGLVDDPVSYTHLSLFSLIHRVCTSRKIRTASSKAREVLDKIIHSTQYLKYLQDAIVTPVSYTHL